MRLRKEEKTISNSEKVVLELNKIYKESIYLDEYNKLLNEYKNLNARYDKNIKVSDTIEGSIIQEKEKLTNSLDYTIKVARNNLLNNIDEHKKTKNALFSYKDKIGKYKNALDSLLKERLEIQKSLEIYKKHYGEIKHEFYPTFEKSDILENDKVEKLKNISFEKILSLVLKNDEDIFLLKLELKDFLDISKKVNLVSNMNSFIDNLQKFIQNNLDENSIVYYDEDAIFYVILVDYTTGDIEILERKLNQKRNIFDARISFNISASKYIENKYSCNELIRVCGKALEEAKRKDINLIIKD